MTSNNFDKYLSSDPNTPTIADNIHSLLMYILTITSLLIFVVIITIVIFMIIKYHNADFFESVLVQKALQKEHYDQPKIQVKGNLVVRGAIVQHDKNKIRIIIPTKFCWQITSKIDLVHEVQTRVRSPEFNAFLASNFEGFIFSEPVFKSNNYIITGNQY